MDVEHRVVVRGDPAERPELLQPFVCAGLLGDENDLVTFYYDRRRFQPY